MLSAFSPVVRNAAFVILSAAKDLCIFFERFTVDGSR